jgi:hypothetical protein
VSHDDFHTEPVPGLPAHLPEGEELLWQGAPDRKVFARTVLHERKILAYFFLVGIWKFATALYDGGTVIQGLISASFILLAAALVQAIIWWYSRAIHRSTIYSLTNKRLVMRFGIALPVTFNYPFAQVTGANVKAFDDDQGDITLELAEHTKVSWAILWPHTRPWHLTKPQPSLRALENLSKVSGMLSDQLHAFHNVNKPANAGRQVQEKQQSSNAGGLATATAAPESRV